MVLYFSYCKAFKIFKEKIKKRLSRKLIEFKRTKHFLTNLRNTFELIQISFFHHFKCLIILLDVYFI